MMLKARYHLDETKQGVMKKTCLENTYIFDDFEELKIVTNTTSTGKHKYIYRFRRAKNSNQDELNISTLYKIFFKHM